MTQLTDGWQVDVERGPDWLFVKLHPDQFPGGQPSDVADRMWALLQCHLLRRLVVELDDVPLLSSHLIGQLLLLQKRVHANGGLMRVCGVSPAGKESLRALRLREHFADFSCREEAVMGYRPLQPR